MTRLVHLDLSGHETMTDACIQLIAERLPRLSYLDVRAHASLPDSQSRPKCTDTGIASMRDLQQLRSLSLSNAQVISLPAHSMQQSSVCLLLTPFTLDCKSSTHSKAQVISCICRKQGWSESQCIIVVHPAMPASERASINLQVQRKGCRAIAALSQLRRLEISQCQSLTDTAACELTRLTGLQELCLSNSSRVTDIALSTLVRMMPDLLILDLSGCHLHVSDVSMHAMADLSKLQVGLFPCVMHASTPHSIECYTACVHSQCVGSNYFYNGASGGQPGTTDQTLVCCSAYVSSVARASSMAARPLSWFLQLLQHT